MAPAQRVANPGAEGRGEICCEPLPEVAVRGCTLHLCVSLPVTSHSLVVQKGRVGGVCDGEPGNS